MKVGDSPKPIFGRPKFRLREPDAVLSADEFELLGITAEDLRFLAASAGEDWIETPPEIRAVSTILRRLFVQGDIHKAANLAGWNEPFEVKTDLLIYENPHPQVIVVCGGNRWGGDTMPSTSSTFGGPGLSAPPQEWSFLKDQTISLQRYLASLSIAMIGTRIKRSDIIKYVSNKKAAHLSETRHNAAQELIDHLWHGLFMTRKDGDGNLETINFVYLELLGIINAVAESESIQMFAKHILKWVSGYEFEYGPEVSQRYDLQFPVDPRR
jgi:hypothetical protein